MFRQRHLLAFLEEYEEHNSPVDRALDRYFREHKALGSKDRKAIGSVVYGMCRWKGMLDWLYASLKLERDQSQLQEEEEFSWEERYEAYLTFDPDNWMQKVLNNPDAPDISAIPLHVQASAPRWIVEKLSATYGLREALRLCLAINTPAPTTVRVNTAKISRDDLLARWADTYPVTPCHYAPAGIRFARRVPLLALPEYREGLFQLQDEASQLASRLVDAKPGDHVLDYCAGSGGKTLAIAPQMCGKGQLYLHDVRPRPLIEAKKRLKHAGVQNAQIVSSDNLSRLKGKMDWVLVDAPCSGSGTWRRNVDAKWRLTQEELDLLIATQQQIVKEAMAYLKPGGKLVYITCSLFPEENREQLAFFQKTLSLRVIGDLPEPEEERHTPFLKPTVFVSPLVPYEMDAFFAVVLDRGNAPSV